MIGIHTEEIADIKVIEVIMSEITLSVSTAVMSSQSAESKLSQAIQQSNKGQQEPATSGIASQKKSSASISEQDNQKRVDPTAEASRNNQGQLQGGGILVDNQA